jgi:2-dehydro-3-deoxyglucarate aldolase/4-hydroxy-2-oxoheptanedioate aldolase
VTRLPEATRCLFGTWVKLPTTETLELLAHAGFDFVVVDMEHAPLTLESTARLIASAQTLGMSALVRIADQTSNDYQRLLDSGADGVLVPRIRNQTEARNAVARMRFAPLGERGMGMTSRAGRWGLAQVADYLRHGNEGVLRCMQLEDRDVLESVERVLDVDGVNAAFLGMGDLTLATGLPGTHPDLQALVARLLAACAQRKIPCGAAVQDPVAARRAAERGFAFVMVSNDATIFAKAVTDIARHTWGEDAP